MHRISRQLLGSLALVATAACSADTATQPTAELEGIDPTLGAAAAQASLPGLTMDAPATFDGASDARRGTCVYSAPVGRFVCESVVRNGLTTTRSFAMYDAAGTAQSKRDSTTRSTNTQVTVQGTTTTDRGSATVDRASSLTVSGLGRTATTHTLNGSESGHTTRTSTGERGTVTVSESFSASTSNVVVPVPRGRTAWPLSGTTTRSSSLTVTAPGRDPRTSTSSQQVTYTGTSVVNVTITRDGTTRRCTRDLAARGSLSCE